MSEMAAWSLRIWLLPSDYLRGPESVTHLRADPSDGIADLPSASFIKNVGERGLSFFISSR